MRTPEEMVDQFRKGQFIDTNIRPGCVHLKHVQAIGHLEVTTGRHLVYVLTVRPHPLLLPAFETAEDAQAFIQRCVAAYPLKQVQA